MFGLGFLDNGSTESEKKVYSLGNCDDSRAAFSLVYNLLDRLFVDPEKWGHKWTYLPSFTRRDVDG